MKKLWTLFALLVLSLLSHAQAPDARKVSELNTKAIEALQAKKYDEGIKLLNEVLALLPKDKGTAYNLACAFSLKADIDGGIGWLEKAAEWGWGSGTGTIYGTQGAISEIEMCRKDADLANLQKDPRFEPTLAKMQANVDKRKAQLKLAEDYAAKPATYVPEKLKDAAELPLLVVVHDVGSTKEQVISGFWKGVADELGFALVAPSGKTMVSDEPAKGMAWFENVNTYLDPKESWKSEKPIHDAVSAFKKERKIDSTRVVLIGEGGMGAMVAYGAGISSPGLYKVVIALDGPFVPQAVAAKTANAAKMGQKAAVLWDTRLEAQASEADKKQLAEGKGQMDKTLKDAGLGALTSYTSDEKDPAVRHKAVVELVKSLATGAPAKPVEAGTPK